MFNYVSLALFTVILGRNKDVCSDKFVPSEIDTPIASVATQRLIGCLHDPANVLQTSSISTCIVNTFAGSFLDVCWIV